MIWALLAAFLRKRPPWVQAAVVGLCAGLFVATAAEANQRTPLIGTVCALVLVVGVVTGALFYLGLRAQRHHGWPTTGAPPAWVSAVYVTVWILSILAAVRALFGEGGFKVAVLAIVPIVLLAPPALFGVRAVLRRTSARDTDEPTSVL